MNDLISVIIPVYNTESYLENCLNSAILQTYQNLEIILINDGSTDHSYSICESYAKKDKRIKFINKENEGIAKTRNLGIASAKGKYIYFIDSDDYVEYDTIERLYTKAVSEQADLCVTGCIQEYEDGSKYEYTLAGFEKYSKDEAIEALCLNKELHSYLWGCLIDKNLLKGIEFIPNRNYEDLDKLYKIYIKANKIVFVCAPLCHYRIRSGSITSFKSPEDLMIVFNILRDRNEFVTNYHASLSDACYYSTYLCVLDLLYRINKETNKNYVKEQEELLKYIKIYKTNFYKNKYLSQKQKMVLFMVMYVTKPYFYIYHFKSRKNRKR